MAAAPVAYLRELERRDDALAAAFAEVSELAARTQGIAASGRQLAALLERLPREREAAAQAADRARALFATRRAEVAEAEAALADAGRDREARAAAAEQARHALEAAEDELASAARRADDLDRTSATAAQEAAFLDREAKSVADRLRSAPRMAARAPRPPESGLDGVQAWSARAGGALLLARSALQAEWDAVVREANELGAVVLEGALAQAGVAQIRNRAEALLGD
ncbi:MAG: hypothetical protein ABR583_11375 [Gaiellaceae bacterium]